MLSLTLGTAHTATFSYSGTTSKLTSVTENGSSSSVTYDSAGNETSYGKTPAYSARNFLASFGNTGSFQASYTLFYYGGRGVRVGVTRHTYVSDFVILEATTGSVYTPELNLIHQNYACSGGGTEMDCEGHAVVRDFIWFAGRPVAQEEDDTTPDGTTHSVAWTFADHLGTAIIQTDSTPAVSWRMEFEPFGPVSVARAGDPSTQPLRFPGQEDTPYGNYNIFRWYRPNWGRYTQADPIQAVSWIDPNLFAFVRARPTNQSDRLGLLSVTGSCDCDPDFPGVRRGAARACAYGKKPGCSDLLSKLSEKGITYLDCVKKRCSGCMRIQCVDQSYCGSFFPEALDIAAGACGAILIGHGDGGCPFQRGFGYGPTIFHEMIHSCGLIDEPYKNQPNSDLFNDIMKACAGYDEQSRP